MSKVFLIIKKSPISGLLTIISFVLFLLIYVYICLYIIESYMIKGLIFIIPSLVFGFISYLTVKGKLKKLDSNLISLALIFVLGFIMFICIIFISFDAASTITTDVEKYQKVLRITNYPDNELTKYFPSKIPENAEDIVFYYHPALGQGGEVTGLKFKTDSVSIDNYINEFNEVAIWIGNDESTLDKYGINSHTTNIFGYKPLSKDFITYIFVSKIGNHGKLSFVSISKVRNEIIFYSDRW